MRFLKAFGQFWYDFIIGDDWKIAAAVVSALAVTALLLVSGVLAGAALVLFGAVAIVALFAVSMVIDVRGS
ncbi:MAG: hypothetical protein ACRDTQ_07595 [Micromonosporaceae bacterium]